MKYLTTFIILTFIVLNLIPKNHYKYLGLSTKRRTHSLTFYDEKIFYRGVNQSNEERTPPLTHPISGGIVPHHTLTSNLIANFFKRLARQNPETIILIGPNHRELGNFSALSGTNGWETPFGILETNKEITNQLAVKKLIKIEDSILTHEQSIAALTPYIKYYQPQVELVPIILKSSMDVGEAEKLAEIISTYLSKKVVLIASVDFSHYLTDQEANKNDKVTFQTIRNSNLSKLFTLNSDYLDSPPAVATLLLAMKNIQANTITMHDYINYANTSCFVLTFHRKDDRIEK